MKNQKIIELKNVSVSYKERKSFFKSTEYEALKDISFDVYQGEVLGVIGRNGAGKSTLLRILAGIYKPDSGEIIHHTKSISLMALAAGFDPNLSGRQNARISGMLMGRSRKEVNVQLDGIKDFSELQEFFEKPAKNYSSGMKARLAFSIAMHISPDVLLIDEILGVGDASFRKKAEQALEEKIASNITVIIVSHAERQVMRLAERVIWIDGGVVRKQGLPKEIFPDYNLNVQFSTFGLKVEKYQINEFYLVLFENLRIEKNTLHFNVVCMERRGLELGVIKCVDLESELIVELKGPTETPLFSKRYPNIKNSHNSRYHKGSINIGSETILVNENDIPEDILKIKLSWT